MKADSYIHKIIITLAALSAGLIACLYYIASKYDNSTFDVIFIALSIMFILLLFLSQYTFMRIKKRDRRDYLYQHNINTISKLNGIRFLTYKVKERRFLSLIKMDDGKYLNYSLDTFFAVTHPQDLPIVKEMVERLNRGEAEKMTYEYRLKSPDTDTYDWRFVIIRPLEIDSKGKVTSYIGSDMNNEKAHEMTNNLSLFRKKILFITSINLTMFIQYNRKERIFIRLDNTGENESHDIPLNYWLEHIYPDDLPICKQLLKVMDEQLEEQYHTEYRYNFPEKYRWFAIDVAVYEKDENGEYLSYLCLCRDIDARMKELQKETELLHKAELANRLKDSFINNLSHEIRTPLNAIVGFSNLIDRNLTDKELTDYKKIINDNNNQLLSVIDSTIDKSLFESNTMVLNIRALTVKELLDKVYQSQLDKIPHGISFNIEYDKNNITVNTDERWISNIINALIKNAITFTQKGSITLGYQCQDSGVLIYVKDTGIGIAPKDQQRIFEMFEQVDHFTPGLGMGLNLCKTAVARLSGSIGVESEEGKGSKFWFWIPCDYPSKPARAQ